MRQVDRRPYHDDVALARRHAASLAVPGDQLQLDLFAIPSDDFRYFYGQLKASIPISASGMRITLAGARGDQFQRLVGPDQHGKSRQLTADLAFPFVKSRAASLVGHISLADWKSAESRAGALIQRDRLQVLRGWLEFSRASTFRIDGRVAVSQGLDLISATDEGDPLASRPRADARFTKFNLDLQIARNLSPKLYLRLDTAVQFATSPLLAPEEFALGGNRIGRAFDFNELTGDHGVGAMLELGYRIGDVGAGPKGLELFAFADGGGTFRKHESPGLPDKQWLAGAGAGARFSAMGFVWAAEFGIPIARSHADRDARAFFSVARNF